ncbi:MAG: chorismate-binding protein [Bacteroidia bacterium]|nr:chorismate-binding protein [Bacteroidia bacterium]
MENNSSNAFALFKLPNSKNINWVNGICTSEFKSIKDIPNNTFVISSFNSSDLAYYFPFQKVNEFHNESLTQLIDVIDSKVNFNFKTSGEESYIKLVSNAVNTLRTHPNSFKKVVLANTKTIEKTGFEPISFFKKLAEYYPSAFVYCAFTPASGWWIGASPETLITSHQNQYTSIALAGTLPPNAQRSFNDKEIEEQHLVELFIEEKLKEAKLSFLKNGPEAFATGHLTHLKTSYVFGSNQNQEEILDLLKIINPTPAVAGLPAEKALAFIKEYEGISREFYAGFIGIKQQDNLQLFVNLRCLHWQKPHITLFAGAGITEDSDPKSEWEETQHKMNTLEKFLFTIFASGILFYGQII